MTEITSLNKVGRAAPCEVLSMDPLPLSALIGAIVPKVEEEGWREATGYYLGSERFGQPVMTKMHVWTSLSEAITALQTTRVVLGSKVRERKVNDKIANQTEISRFIHASPADYWAQLNLPIRSGQLVHDTVWSITNKSLGVEKSNYCQNSKDWPSERDIKMVIRHILLENPKQWSPWGFL